MAKTIGTNWTELKSYVWVPGTGFRCTFYLEAKYATAEKNNIEGNYSVIQTRLRSVVNAGQGSGYGYNFTCSYAPTVSGSGQWFLGNETITQSEATQIKHNDDGTKTITLTATGSISPIGLNFSISEDVILETIPRATKIPAQSGTIGHNITIKWTRASKNFTHKLTYSFGSIKDEVLGTNLGESYQWTIPTKLYKEFTAQSGKGTLKLTTYNGSTQIGSTQEAELTIYANESFSNPVVQSSSAKDINSKTTSLTGNENTFVLNQSKAFITLSFKTRNFATLKSITLNNVAIDNSKIESGTQSTDGTTSYGLQYEYGTFNTNTFKFKITDSRGYSIEHSLIISDGLIINYVPLDVVPIFKRIAPTTGEVGLEFDGNYFNGSFGATSNSLTIYYKYKKSTESNYTTVNLIKDTHYKISGNKYYSGTGSAKQVIKLAPSFDYKSQYDVQLFISDKLTTLPTINAIISKGIPIFWWNGEKVVVNGDLYIADENGENAVNVGDVIQYSPNSAGTNGQYWKSDGNGRGVWQSLSTSPTSGSNTAITSGGVYTAVNNLKPVVLFTSDTGTQGSFSLSDNIKNYTKLEIVAGFREYHEVSIVYPNVSLTDSVILAFDWHDGTQAFGRFGSLYKMSGKTFTYQSSFRFYKYRDLPTSTFDTNNTVWVYRVIGYK